MKYATPTQIQVGTITLALLVGALFPSEARFVVVIIILLVGFTTAQVVAAKGLFTFLDIGFRELGLSAIG